MVRRVVMRFLRRGKRGSFSPAVPKSIFFPIFERPQRWDLQPTLPYSALAFDQLTHETDRGRALDRALPEVLRHFFVQRQRFRRRGDHGHADADIGLLTEPERAED